MDPIFVSTFASVYRDEVLPFLNVGNDRDRYVIHKAPRFFPNQFVVFHRDQTVVKECLSRTSAQIKSFFGERILTLAESL